jgi:hypothetical protein
MPEPIMKGSPFEESYPCVTKWIKKYGWIELGQDEYSSSLVRVLDGGGLIWEGKERYTSLDEALQALEAGLKQWMEEENLKDDDQTND